MTEFNIGDKVKITGTDGSYTTYQVWADMVGSKRFTRDKYPSLTGELEVISVAPHQSQNVTLYLLGGDEGEFIFDNSFGDIELVEKKPRTKVGCVKCEDEFAWQLVKEFEEDVEFYTCGKGVHTSKNIGNLISVWRDGNLHRRIETTMTEREAFIDGLSDWAEDSGLNVSAEVWDSLFDSDLVKLVS